MEPVLGEQAICGMCRERIVFVGSYWDHIGENKPKHPAMPEMPQPISKEQAFDAFIAALDAAGVKDNTAIIEALYVYREALLRWQRLVIDDKAREAELALRILRSYTRKEPE